MSQIHVLDQNTIDKIAAGEVVERPASVVKELAENAIDAGASHITVEIRDGGITMIRVTDDGKGIAPEEIRLAFLRHATSKIESVEDLIGIGSLGFRGEALSSIAAVSRVELITKQADELTAVRYLLDGGREKLFEEIGAPDGTTIIVRDIFYNTPARAKFLKTAMTEAAHVGGYVEQLALSNPGIAFDFIVNGTSRITTTGSGKVRDAIYHIYGRELASEILPVDYSQDGIKITGFIAKPSVSRGNRNFENYYVNGRYVKSRVISLGIEEGYGNKLMQHQYPFTCLMITVDGDFVDVNVHPTKMDVRFSDERFVMRGISDCIRKTLYDQEMILRQNLNPPVKPSVQQEKPVKYNNPEPFERQMIMQRAKEREMIRETAAPYGSSSGQDPLPKPPVVTYDIGGTPSPAPDAEPARSGSFSPAEDLNSAGTGSKEKENAAPSLGEKMSGSPGDPGATAADASGKDVRADGKEETYEQQTLPGFLDIAAKPNRRIIGCAFRTYWIVEYGDRLFMIDQHAAHEKVLYTRFMREYESSSVSSQQLDPPIVVTLGMDEQALYEEYRDAFRRAGFEIESFGGREYKISAVPHHMSSLGSKSLFTEMLDHLDVSSDPKKLEIYVHRVATEACKAAVKGGDALSVREAEALIDELLTCEDPYHCPHGRPTIISFTEKDLEKRFKRII
ncbi:MAG: DNA mismatch repair endonuclease MutL [Lachnospiraceae bacterium]|nr:DNA mismatch repair endonuclease MutL [Lachnospiraceae bacterium]